MLVCNDKIPKDTSLFPCDKDGHANKAEKCRYIVKPECNLPPLTRAFCIV